MFSADIGGVLRVWDRVACNLHAIGEAVPGLSGPIAWQPNGRHIYAAQQEGSKQRVVLFERNGLSHGSFECTTDGKKASSFAVCCCLPTAHRSHRGVW